MEEAAKAFDFAAELERLRPRLVSHARKRWYKRFSSEHSPEDLAADAILRAYEHREEFRGSSIAELAGYVRTILDNQINSHLARLESRPDAEPFSSGRHTPRGRATTPSARMIRDEEREFLLAALNILEGDERRVLELIRMENRSYKEAAAIMGRPEYALQRLRKTASAKLVRVLKSLLQLEPIS